MKRGIFLDRDGTLIRDTGYVKDPEGIELIPGAREALQLLQDMDCMLFMFTNQSGVWRGYYPMEAVYACNERMFELLSMPQKIFAEICIAPEHPDAPSKYRKPSPAFITEMLAKHSLDPQLCWMVGDRSSDLQTGINAGIQSAALLTGDPSFKEKMKPLIKEHSIPVFDDVLDFAKSLQA